MSGLAVALALVALWGTAVAAISLSRWRLLVATWREPYVAEPVVILESDDWGPGPPDHAVALDRLLALLGRHRDACGRPAILTANLVMAVPDPEAIASDGHRAYHRRLLDAFPEVVAALRRGHGAGLLCPQLHGLDHLHPEGLLERARGGDTAVLDWLAAGGLDWEALPSPLQGHYVDGSVLPTRPVAPEVQEALVTGGVEAFTTFWGHPPASAVAPCYLWDDTTERAWATAGVRYVQTAGYRCTGRDAGGHYRQEPPWLPPGLRSSTGLVYLVRNVMYEPRDGRGATEAWRTLRQRVSEAQPAVLSTHRYNYTGVGAEEALSGLDGLLGQAERRYPRLRFLASPEWGRWIEVGEVSDPLTGSQSPLTPAPPRRKVAAFLRRLWNRHAKIRVVALATGLVVPAAALCGLLDPRPGRGGHRG